MTTDRITDEDLARMEAYCDSFENGKPWAGATHLFVGYARRDLPALVAEVREARADIDQLADNYVASVTRRDELQRERDEARAALEPLANHWHYAEGEMLRHLKPEDVEHPETLSHGVARHIALGDCRRAARIVAGGGG